VGTSSGLIGYDRFLAIVLCVAAAAFSGNAIPAEQPTKVAAAVPIAPGEKVSSIARATIFVRDQEQSLKLYRDILGLKVYIDNVVEGSAINAIMGTTGVTLRAAILQAGDTTSGNLGIYEIVGEKSSVLRPQRRTHVETGDAAVVFYTRNLDAIAAQVELAGYRVVAMPLVLFNDPAKIVQTREMLFFDADNVLVNLIEEGRLRAGP